MEASNILENGKTFEQKWTIRNWTEVPNTNSLHVNSKTEFHLKEENIVYAKFLVEVTSHRHRYFIISWNLLSKLNLENAEATLLAIIIRTDGTEVQYVVQADPLTEKKYEARQTTGLQRYLSNALFTNAEGHAEVKLRCTLKAIRSSEITEFRKTSMNTLSQNLADVLNGINRGNSDVKIRTKDNIELFAHKIFLQARCPVFSTMFGSAFLESRTGIINIDDISAKTMQILLNYWYTGELVPSWMDDDTIVEFTYAAEKYQVIPVIKMLNDFLGRHLKVTTLDMELLKITHQLSLKKAEDRILKRIIHKCSEAKTGAELLDFLSIPIEKFDGKGETASHIFEAFNDAMRENDNDATHEDVKMMALACGLGMRNVETRILKRVIDTVSKVGSTDELLSLFNLRKSGT